MAVDIRVSISIIFKAHVFVVDKNEHLAGKEYQKYEYIPNNLGAMFTSHTDSNNEEAYNYVDSGITTLECSNSDGGQNKDYWCQTSHLVYH